VEESRFGPMQVLEDDQQRLDVRKRFKKPPGCPENLPSIRLALIARAKGAAQPLRDTRRIHLAVEEGLDRVRRVVAGARLADHLTQRPERDALPVGKAAAGENVHLMTKAPGKLVDKARLPESCLA